jgi:GTP-binding protein HflX
MTQVELAQLEYSLPRLVRQWSHLERQEGAIGTRGPGETQLETDRRAIRRRISQLKRDLDRIARQRETRRRSRDRFYKAAIVGYTNVGKSTLFNALTSAEVLVEDRLFATLDASIRAVQLEGERILIADTVGFIRKLPHHLVASFRSTLEESLDADLLLHVVDASHPRFEDQMRTVEDTLKELDVAGTSVLTVFNKADRLPDLGLISDLSTRHPQAVWISALKGMGLVALRRELSVRLQSRETEFEVRVPIRDGRMLAAVYEHSRVIARTETDEEVVLRCRAKAEAVQQVMNLVRQA